MRIQEMLYKAWAVVLLGGIWSLAGCIDPFEPPVPAQTTRALVVDGTINSQGISTFTLAQTYGLQAESPLQVNRAKVFIQGEQGLESYPLREEKSGLYVSQALTLNPANNYRLYFQTADGKQYASAFEPVKNTPPIDAVSWRLTPSGLQFSVATHDDSRQAVYYRWHYEETWEYTAYALTTLAYEEGKVFRREDDIYRCWQSVPSTRILLANTKPLTRDVVAGFPLVAFEAGNERFRTKYSLLVRQQALSLANYQYLESIQKNTEAIGTIFDPLPSHTTGNVRNLYNDQEIVLGFVGVNSITEKRIFVLPTQLPADWRYQTGNPDCGRPDTIRPYPFIPFAETVEGHFGAGLHVPVQVLYGGSGQVTGYVSYPTECVDCRLRGSNTRPTFWD